ncbi:alpha/beta fold hydrolase [Sulfitobacter donghicola]|uniref:Hydrolase n=1 Tax=Sulfitobacter donghicola DSW-25 = KCTC 12864 = JCM 14565 TaxID=1300350 RepID=A0A073IHN7_9RHOB|nr:alpha/beta hydrolase [Sulfitobacter donghicola]KEJ89304.1 hydrolase [Sulfitobacter donghicola DSW-25 = KCTC 12864 = JCM 14565]KIN69107.1 Lysophospholipase [Sulfitobacter donghicola DSW-25 = KCTC 12864 = JCM 14565]
MSSLSPAPLFTDLHAGPEPAAAHWTTTSDGKKIRLGVWTPEGARGTVLIFPGRTEYVEKYGPAAAEFASRGLASLAIDWRGQGLADRLIDDPLVGYVEHFTDYQKDVAAAMRAARELNLPRPYYLVAHSMGGCIGLRAVMEGLPVQAAAFTGPMWGINIAPHLRIPSRLLSTFMPKFNQGHRLVTGTLSEPYVLSSPFDDNMLTTDQEMFDMMRDQVTAHPDLQLGGPSYTWLREALTETDHLAERAAPNLPCITFVGTNERIVDIPRIHQRMESWKGGQLRVVEGGEHEVLLETPDIRTPVFQEISGLFLNTAAG